MDDNSNHLHLDSVEEEKVTLDLKIEKRLGASLLEDISVARLRQQISESDFESAVDTFRRAYGLFVIRTAAMYLIDGKTNMALEGLQAAYNTISSANKDDLFAVEKMTCEEDFWCVAKHFISIQPAFFGPLNPKTKDWKI